MGQNSGLERARELFCSLHPEKQDTFLGILEALNFAAGETEGQAVSQRSGGSGTGAAALGVRQAVTAEPELTAR